jgi:hypothetical protein
MNSKNIIVPRHYFVLLWAGYCMVTYYALLATSYGWHGVVYQQFGKLLFTSLFLFGFGFVFLLQKKRVYLDSAFILVIFIMHLLFLALNPGDCADAGGTFVFIETWFRNIEALCADTSIYAAYILLIGFVAYIVLLSTFFVKIFRSS